MPEIFTMEKNVVGHALDIVQWILGSHKIRLYYPTAFKISGAMRVAGKAGVDAAGGNVALWRELAKYELEAPFLPVNPEYRRSGYRSNLKKWQVDVEGEIVVVHLDELTAKFHCTDALQLQAQIDVAARNAKAWAGDDSTAFVVAARLTDAAAG